MTRTARAKRRLFVLDTNVLMHDPTAIFRFEEHDIYIPMIVLEELDAGKKGLSEAARNVRQVSRFLDELMQGATKEEIDRGLALPTVLNGSGGKRPPAGRLFFQTKNLDAGLPERAVRRGELLGRAVTGVVVEGEGPAGDTRRCLERVRMPVVGGVRRGEDDETVEQRGDRGLLARQ